MPEIYLYSVSLRINGNAQQITDAPKDVFIDWINSRFRELIESDQWNQALRLEVLFVNKRPGRI